MNQRPRTQASRRPANHRPVWMGRPSLPLRLLKFVVAVVVAILMLYPFIYVITASFGTPGSHMVAGLYPSEFSLNAYRQVLRGSIITRALMVSAGVTIVGTLVSLTATTLLAYGLTRTKEVRGTKFVLLMLLFSMLFGAGIIPSFLMVKTLGLLNSYWALILPTAISAFNVLVVRNFFMQLPAELLDSARIDRASELQIFLRIVLPLSKAVLAVISLFYAVGYWNSFFNAMIYLNDTAKWPIQLVLNSYAVQGAPIGELQNPNAASAVTPQAIQMAIVVLATAPILAIYPFAQRFFTKGVLTGAIKG